MDVFFIFVIRMNKITFFFFSSRRRHTRWTGDWSSDVCSSDLHDIGKISIPDAILHKPGPLTAEEWAIMRRHPQVSCDILEQAGGIFHLLAHIVVAHHERWDGCGYPNGLAQETIPIGARIISVVDSFDAMTSRRVYRESLPIEQAKGELRRCSGSQYDPQVVAAFLRILDEQEQGMLPLERTGPAHFTATEQEQAAPLTYR